MVTEILNHVRTTYGRKVYYIQLAGQPGWFGYEEDVLDYLDGRSATLYTRRDFLHNVDSVEVRLGAAGLAEAMALAQGG